ncbi:MAG: DUF1778 domain-containing protein [Betaproteobacteria bacterium]|nr:MAG: DUF1778 domain-containing protein [Betaproteobacteria bacterium]TAG43846.1 MAG: DUF1778 domain-containing protein [Betaproteobacteria bacterium]
MTVTTTARFDLKMDAAEKALLSQAAALMGTTMASFVRTAAKEKAGELLERQSRLTLSQRDFDSITAAVNTAFAANDALKGALKAAESVKRA